MNPPNNKEGFNMQIQNKVAIVTGATSGIGRASALLFAREGASVVLSGRRQNELDAVRAEIESNGGRAVAVAGDVREEQYARELVETAVDRFGGLDIAFNNAGVTGPTGPVNDLNRADWDDVIATNLTSAFLGAKYQVPAMVARGGGSLIFTSSFVGHANGFPGMSAYAAAKAGLVALTRVLAAELGPQAIRVNAILPGGTDTPSNVVNAPGAAPETRAFIEGLHALKRLATPEEIARSVLYLASEASSFMTGAAMLVDGGVSIAKT